MRKIVKLLLKYIPRPLLIKISLLLNKPMQFFYKGNDVECTVCEKQFKKFMPYGYGDSTKLNRLCPSCLSLERHRLLWLYFKQKTNLFTDEIKLLHMAPEQPFIKRFRKSKNINYTTADLESPIADVKTDIRDMSFEDNHFDAFICNHVMEHIDDEQKALKEVLRVLKPGAWAILQVPIDYSLEKTYEDNSIVDPKEREKHFGQYDHVRQYGLDYPERLRQAGFKVLEEKFVETFSDEEIERYRFDKNEIIYLCVKE